MSSVFSVVLKLTFLDYNAYINGTSNTHGDDDDDDDDTKLLLSAVRVVRKLPVYLLKFSVSAAVLEELHDLIFTARCYA